jgi:hypothetical protein
MTLDDRSLREHLDRRAEAGASDVEQIAEVVMSRVTSIERDPWWRRLGVRAPAAAVAVAALLVIAVAVAVLPPPSAPGPGASPTSPEPTDATGYPAVRAMTAAEFEDVLFPVFPEPGSWAGAAMIVDVEISEASISCPVVPEQSGTCPTIGIQLPGHAFVIDGPTGVLDLDGPYAFRLREAGGLELIGAVRPGPDGLAWTLPQLTAELPNLRGPGADPVSRLYLVDAWRAVSSAAIPCPSSGSPLAIPDFTCGAGIGWLVPDEASIPADPLAVPSNGLRVPNAQAPKERGYWLVDPFVDADPCFMCSPAGAADLIGRVPTVNELELMPPATTAPPETTAPPVDAYPADRPLSADDLDRILSGDVADSVGRTFIVDVQLRLQTELRCPFGADCPEYLVDLPSGRRYIQAAADPLLGPPYALQVREGGGLDLLGSVRPGPNGLAWTLSDYLAGLPELFASDRLTPQVYLVAATAVRMAGSPFCALQTRPPQGLDFGCGQAAWLVPAGAVMPSDGLSAAPDGGVRIQNDPGIEWPGEGTSAIGYYLVRPLQVDDCFLCTPGATSQLLEQVDQIAVPTNP